MNVSTFIDKLKSIATDYKTLYVMGCFGAPLVGSNVGRYQDNHPYNRRAERSKMIYACGNKNPPYFGFDCVCLLKGVLWGWNGDEDKTYGGAVYKSNGVPDLSADIFFGKCTRKSVDFKQAIPGALLWKEGHIGCYIGDGLAVECTPSWENKVQITAVRNIGRKDGYNDRQWSMWGICPYLNYNDEEEITITEAELRKIVRDELENALEDMDKAKATEPWEQSTIREAKTHGIMDGSRPKAFATRTEAAAMVLNYMKKVDGRE